MELNGAKILYTIHTNIPVLGDFKITQTLVSTWIVMALLSALADRRRIGSLRLAVFDLLETDGKPVRGSYGEIWKRLEGIFSGGKLVHPVEMEVAASAEGVEAIYDDWVEREGGEGLVVRSDGPFVYKIKPLSLIHI